MAKFIRVESSTIKGVSYNAGSQHLVIWFKGNNYYKYSKVPLTVYENFLNAESKGKFFDKNIKDEYSSIKII